MKTKLKTLPERHVFAYSDIKHGFLGRNEAVRALKAIIDTIDDEDLLTSVDKIPIGKDPQTSLYNFIRWLEAEYPNSFLRSEKGNAQLGFSDVGPNGFYIMPIDFLPLIRRVSPWLETLLLHTIVYFYRYHDICGPFYDGQLHSISWMKETLEDNIRHSTNNINYEKILDDLNYIRHKYEMRIEKIHRNGYRPGTILKKLDNLSFPYRFTIVADIIREMLRMCKGESVRTFSNEALELFAKENEWPINEQGFPEPSDGYPIELGDMYIFTPIGQNEDQIDYIEDEIISNANDTHGHFGTCEYSKGESLADGANLTRLTEMQKKAANFFGQMDKVCSNFMKIRDLFYFQKIH
jgi:hypothetical protein